MAVSVLNALKMLICLILLTVLWERYHIKLHFIDEEITAQKD